MKTPLAIELFGDDTYQLLKMWTRVMDDMVPGLGKMTIGENIPRPWVAKITGRDPKYKYAREFQRAQWDYSKANSVGSRGIYLYYWLDEGCLYEVKEQVTWKRWERYFCRAEAGELVEMSEDEVIEWLKDCSESVCSTLQESA